MAIARERMARLSLTLVRAPARSFAAVSYQTAVLSAPMCELCSWIQHDSEPSPHPNKLASPATDLCVRSVSGAFDFADASDPQSGTEIAA